MIRDNIRAFILHILLIIISTIYLIALVWLSPYIGKFLINPIIRGILFILWASTYIIIGNKLYMRIRSRHDFNAGLLIAVVGFILWAFSLYKIGFNFGEIQEDLSYHYIPLNIYINPIYQMFFLLGIKFNQISRLIACFLPTILIGLGIKYKRFKHSRRKQESF